MSTAASNQSGGESSPMVFSKRWTKQRPVAPLSLSPQSSAYRSRPHTVADPGPRTVKWDVGMAGYTPPAHVTDLQVQSAKSLVKAPVRVRQMIRDPVLLKACFNVGVEPADLVPLSQDAFLKKAGGSLPSDPSDATAVWDSYVVRMARKLAIVMQERDNLLAAKEDDEAKTEELARTMVKTFKRETETEAAKIDREERELNKIAYTIALERAHVDEKMEKFQENQARREAQLAAREQALEEQRERLRERGRKRDAEIAAKNAAIKRMEEEVQEELREEWQAKESRVADIHKKRAEHREAERRAREAEWTKRMAKKQVAYAKEEAAKKRSEEKFVEKMGNSLSYTMRLENQRRARIRDKRLHYDEKRDNAARASLEMHNRRVAFAEKVEADEARLQALADVRIAIESERKVRQREVELARLQYRELQQTVRQKLPGPHEYDTMRSSVLRPGLGGAVVKDTSKGYFDKVVERTRALPSTHDYTQPSTLTSTGGRIAPTSGKSDLDVLLHRTKRLPGAGTYDPAKPMRAAPAVTIDCGTHPSDIDLKMKRGAREPGPGSHTLRAMPRTPPPLKALSRTMSDLGSSVGLKPMFSPLASSARVHLKRGKKGTLQSVDLSKTRFSASQTLSQTLSDTF